MKGCFDGRQSHIPTNLMLASTAKLFKVLL